MRWIIFASRILAIRQRCYAVSKSSNWFVNILSFFQPHRLGAGLIEPLRSSQIHDREQSFAIMPLFDHFWVFIIDFFWGLKALLVDLLFFNPYLFQEYVDDGMWSARILIHSGLIDLPSAHALLYEL
jgi:hypothetical protein